MLENLRKILFPDEEILSSAKQSYLNTKYGMSSMNEENDSNRVKTLIRRIGQTIVNKSVIGEYQCVFELPYDLSSKSEEIQEILTGKGYICTNLSQIIPELDGRSIFFLDWKRPNFPAEIISVEENLSDAEIISFKEIFRKLFMRKNYGRKSL